MFEQLGQWMNNYGLYLPMPIVATLLALLYGRSVHHPWASAVLTFLLVMLGGKVYSAIGQIIGMIVSALLIFLLFSMPEHKRQAHEAARREREVTQLPNEEDL